jgi:ferredoxin
MSKMIIEVDMSVCEHHAQCVLAAPDVFQLNEEGLLEYDPNPDSSHADAVREAVELCPLLAISIIQG